MIKARIRHVEREDAFIVQKKKGAFSPWRTCKKKSEYRQQDDHIRLFRTFESAFDFATRTTCDVIVAHKNKDYDPV